MGASSVLELVFPRRCFSCGLRTAGPSPLCRRCEDQLTGPRGPLCYACHSDKTLSSVHTSGQDCAQAGHKHFRVSAGFLMRGPGADLIHRLKYSGATSLAPFIAGRMLAAWAQGPGDAPDFIVPVPLHERRLKERGYNQSLLLAERLSVGMGALTVSSLLVRVRPTRAQAGLAGALRPGNVEGAFDAPNPSALEGRTAMLVDDVATTGATLRTCAEVLLRSGVIHVSALVGALS